MSHSASGCRSGTGTQDLPGTTPEGVPAVAVETTAERPETRHADAGLHGLRASLDRALAAGDQDAFFGEFDWDAYKAAAAAGLNQTDEDMAAAVRGIKRGFWTRTLGDAVEQHGVVFLRIRDLHGAPSLLYRVASTTGRFSYIDFITGVGSDGRTAIHDMWILAAGERSTATTNGILALSEPADWKPLSSELLSPNVLEVLAQVLEARSTGDHARALALLKSLPAPVRETRFIRFSILQAASNAGDGAELSSALAAFEQDDPEFVSGTYWAVIRAAKVGEWDNALAGIDRINVFVGGDPYLGTARADLLWLAGRADAARRQAAKTIEEDPSVKRYLCDELQQAAE
jgi:hypothetical protein